MFSLWKDFFLWFVSDWAFSHSSCQINFVSFRVSCNWYRLLRVIGSIFERAGAWS